MSKKWRAAVFKGNGENWDGAMAGIANPGKYVEEIFLNKESFFDDDYASLFVYMFRRFGMPQSGSDPYKELACWYITTPDPAVALMVSPRPCGLYLSFGYLVNTDIYNYQTHSDIEAIREKIEPSLKRSMKDLLTPTNIRDVYINAIGRVRDEDVKDTCDYFEWAGYGVTPDYYEKFNNEGKKKI
jgi:hypothetical protein